MWGTRSFTPRWISLRQSIALWYSYREKETLSCAWDKFWWLSPSAFFFPPQPNQMCMLDCIYRLHSGCLAQTNKCSSSALLSPEPAGPLCCHCKQLSSPWKWYDDQVQPLTHTPGHGWVQAWRCCNTAFPSHVILRFISLGIRVWYTGQREGKLGPKNRSI